MRRTVRPQSAEAVRLLVFNAGVRLLATEIAELFATIGADASELDRALAKADKQINGFGNAMSGMANMAKGAFVAAAGATVAAVGGMTAAIGKSVAVAGDLEQQAANISAVFGNMAPPVSEVKG